MNDIMNTIFNFDFQILNFIQENIRNDILDTAVKYLNIAGKYGLIWIVVAVALLFFRKTRCAGLVALLAIAASYALGDLLIKPLIMRPRPFATDSALNLFRDAELLIERPTGYSFPSTHSALAAAFITALFAKNKVLGFIFLVPVVAMVFSRLYLYVHFPTDVLCGVLLGIVMALLFVLLFKVTKLDNKLLPQA